MAQGAVQSHDFDDLTRLRSRDHMRQSTRLLLRDRGGGPVWGTHGIDHIHFGILIGVKSRMRLSSANGSDSTITMSICCGGRNFCAIMV